MSLRSQVQTMAAVTFDFRVKKCVAERAMCD
jgi:hypothetical protein